MLPGEVIIGFDEYAPKPPEGDGRGHLYRKFRPAIVEDMTRITLPCVKITTDDGTTVICSTEHRWLKRNGVTNFRWKTAGRLVPGDKLVTIGHPWVEDPSREAGYLAGIYDGEGCVQKASRRLSFAQLPGAVLDRATTALKALDFEYACHGRGKDEVVQVIIIGGVWRAIRALGILRPSRLILAAHSLWDGVALTKTVHRTAVVTTEPAGDREVIGLRTSTGTFIANGLLSHNSAPRNHPESFEAAHKLSVKTHPHLAYEPNNFIPSHSKCNRQAQAAPFEGDKWTPANWG